MSVSDDIRAALDGEYRPAMEIWKRVGQWSRVTVKHYLAVMATAGECERRVVEIPGGVRNEYRRKG